MLLPVFFFPHIRLGLISASFRWGYERGSSTASIPRLEYAALIDYIGAHRMGRHFWRVVLRAIGHPRRFPHWRIVAGSVLFVYLELHSWLQFILTAKSLRS